MMSWLGTHLRSSEEVHLQEACLELPLIGTVVLEGIQQEGGTLLDQVHLHEHINNLRGVRGSELANIEWET